MGLAEKRALATLQDETLPKYQADLRKITGNEITYVVDWKSFSDNLDAMENLEEKCLKPLLGIFRVITKDKIGKEAVAETIQEIHLTQVEDCNIAWFTLTKGALKMPWDWKGWSGSFFPDSVREKIESLL